MTHHQVLAIGDSVMQGAGPDLYATLPELVPGIVVDAVPSRQFREAVGVLDRWILNGLTPDVVVVHLGTNGQFASTSIDELVRRAACELVVFVNAVAPRDWIETVNERLVAGAERHPERARLVDWRRVASEHPDALKSDGFHLSRSGAVWYAEAISRVIERPLRSPSREPTPPRRAPRLT